MNVYIYRAALYCEGCIRDEMRDRDEILIAFPDWFAGQSNPQVTRTETMIAVLVRDAGGDPDDESTWDSDKAPKGPYENGGGEADTPQHCARCNCFLENPLSGDGYEYVLDAARELQNTNETPFGYDGGTVSAWLDFYGNDGMLGREPPVTIRQVLENETLAADKPECYECGEPMFIDDHGVSHYGEPDAIDYDADADHVAFHRED